MAPRRITDERKLANITAAEHKLRAVGNTENTNLLASMICGACLAQTQKPITYRENILKNVRGWLSSFSGENPEFAHLTIDHIPDDTIIEIYDVVARK